MEKNRSEMNSDFFWDLSSMFVSDDVFEKTFEEVEKRVQDFKPTDLTDINNLERTLQEFVDIGEKVENIYVYANMKSHEDGNIAKYQGYAGKADKLAVDFSTATSFITASIPFFTDEYAKEVLLSEKFATFKHMLKDLFRFKEHTLSPEIEEILASTRIMAETPNKVYSMLNDVDSNYGMIENEKGEEVPLTSGNFIVFLQSKDRELREKAYKQYYSYYRKHKNTTSTLYSSKVKSNVFYAQTKKYPSSLEAALFELNVDKKVYTNLIETVHKYLPEYYKYLEKRKNILGVDKLHFYDLYVSLVESSERKIPYDEAKKEVLESVKILGDDYVKYANECFDNNWIDVYENKGKVSGAYSWGSYTGHPYIMLNYNDTTDSLFTLAHELGHAMHSHYSNINQDFENAGYTIFLAEIASTFNESILMDYSLERSKDEDEKKHLVNYFLEQFKGTIFRQTMFAEFEMKAHELAEKGVTLTTETLSDIYVELLELYFGGLVEIDEEIRYEWTRIPHFYNSFYVYQYATGFSAALAFNALVKENGECAVEKYKGMLKSGGSDYSLEILKKAGVDMTSEKPISLALDKFKELVDKF